LFDAKGEALSITVFFCQVVAVAWIFNGGQFVANAAFNNLGYPMTSTLFNWGRATIGNLPFMYLFVAFASNLELSELQAAVLGQGVGGIVFATFGMLWCWRLVKGLG
jgi:Na+-driven multidrug efflux pump